MTRWNEGSPARYLPAELVLSRAEIGIVVADRDGNVQFVNEHASRLLRLTGEASALAGRTLDEVGLIPDAEQGKSDELSRQVLSGMTWEDTLAARRGDGTHVFLREFAVPMRGPAGDIDDRRAPFANLHLPANLVVHCGVQLVRSNSFFTPFLPRRMILL